MPDLGLELGRWEMKLTAARPPLLRFLQHFRGSVTPSDEILQTVLWMNTFLDLSGGNLS